MARSYYVVLGVDTDATQEEIRAAYRRHAKELHPDISDLGSDPFMEVQEAYGVLGDPLRRRQYDRTLPGGVRVRVVPAGGEAAAPEPLGYEGRSAERLGRDRGEVEPLIPDPEPDISLTGSFETYHPSRDEVVERTWGRGARPGSPKSGHIQQLHVEVPVSPRRARWGGRVRILVPGRVRCRSCGGTGGVGFFECWRCGGTGVVAGELPVEVTIPPGLTRDETAVVPLDHLGIRDVALTVHLRPTEWP